MTDVIQLHETELLPDRPFTNPHSTLRDLAAMEFTLNLLRGVMGQPQYLTMDRRHQQIFWGNPEQQQHRLIVNDAPQLLSRDHFVLVGFFWQSPPRRYRRGPTHRRHGCALGGRVKPSPGLAHLLHLLLPRWHLWQHHPLCR